MITLLKFLIIVTAFAAFVYAAALAMQGNLEMEVVMRDYQTAMSYLKVLLEQLLTKLDGFRP